MTVTLLAIAFIALALFWFFRSAPPDTVIISAGAPGSVFETNAIKYQTYLAGKGIKLKILPSQGSLENLQRLNDPKSRVEVGFIQGGVTNPPKSTNQLVSLGSICTNRC